MLSLKNIIILLLLSTSLKSFGWGKHGHEIVAQIAKQNLKKSVRDSVQKYLGDITFDEASTWMDDQRKNNSFRYLKPWHYVNIPIDETYVVTDKPNIINKLQLAINNLNQYKNLSTDDIKFNLKIVFHLVGDLHQPLHCGYYEDKGGNEIQLQYLGKNENLHHVWDSRIIESNKIDSTTCLLFINRLRRRKIKTIKKTDVLEWVNESRNLLPFVYDFNSKQINEDYVKKSGKVVSFQLVCAGLRLANILNTTFSK